MPWAVGLWRQRTLGQGGTFGKIIFPSMPPLRVFFLATLHRKTEMMLSRRTLVAAEQTGLYSGHIQTPELSQARGGKAMALAINDTAPDFEAETTEGKIRFHDWIGDKWVVLFSHPKDFTPVCTTELGYMAKIKPEFDKRGVKIIGLSVDPVDKHAGWAADIKETQGFAPNYPMIGDTDYNVSKLYGMLPAAISGDPAKRTAADNQTVRNVFVIGPDKKIKLILVYPMTTGRNFDEVLRVIDSLQLTRQAQGGDAGELEARRGRHHRRFGHRRGCQEAISRRAGRRRSPISASCRSPRHKPRLVGVDHGKLA